MILVDSSVWIDFFRGTRTVESEYLVKLLSREEVIIGDIVLLEVLQGCRSDRQFRIFRHAMTTLPVVTIGGQAIAIEAALNFRRLRAMGFTVRKTIDTLIATWCITNNHALLTSDRDFEPFYQRLGLMRAMPHASSTGLTS